MTASKSDDRIRFSCECGAVLTALASQAGHKGKCKRCGQILEIPERSAATVAESSDGAVAVEEVCSICQTVIEEDDEVTICDACGLPFHEECWQENLGCSAYGCWNVNALKTGPDIKIENPLQAPRLEGTPDPMFKHRPRPTQPEPKKQPEVQAREYLIMAACALAAVLSMLSYGLPSLMMIAMTIPVVRERSSHLPLTLPVTCFILSGLGVIFGLILSKLFWFV